MIMPVPCGGRAKSKEREKQDKYLGFREQRQK